MNAMPSISSTPSIEPVAYDSPRALPSNPVLAALHVLFWLFFCPSRWKNYMRRLGPNLRPDIALIELSRADLKHPGLRRLLLLGYVVQPLLLALLLALFFLAAGVAPALIPGSILLNIAGALVLGLVGGMIVSIASGFALVFSVSIVGSVGLALMSQGAITDPISSVNILLAFGVACSLGSSVAASVESPNNAFSGSSLVLAGVVAFLVGLGFGVAAFAVVVQISEIGFSFFGGMLLAAAPAFPIALATWMRAHRWRQVLTSCVVGGLIGGIAGGVTGLSVAMPGGATAHLLYSIFVGIAYGYSLSAHFSLPYVIAERISSPWVGAAVSALQSLGIAIAFASIYTDYSLLPVLPLIGLSLIGLTINWWLPLLLYSPLQLYNLLLLRQIGPWLDQGRLERVSWHAAFWNEHQLWRWSGLDMYIVKIARHDPTEGQRAIDFLSAGRQRWAAQAAQIELDAQRLEACEDVQAISVAHRQIAAGELEGPASALLRSLRILSTDVEVALHQESNYNRRLALSRIEDRTNNLQREFTRSSDTYAKRFEPILAKWRRIINEHQEYLTREVESRQEIDSPYIIGVPLADTQELFVGRTDISARIEQLILTRQSLSLLLYGQRRMGKTSLLNNLGHLLPNMTVPLFVDLQGPVTQANDHIGLLYNISRSMIASARKKRDLKLPELSRADLAQDPFSYFDEWLNAVEEVLRAEHRTALLAFDEFEALDDALNKGRFDDQAVLGMLRNLIQHRPRTFKVLLSGSHTFQELRRWSTYLVGVQVLKVGCLAEPDARKLIEHPVYDFTLGYEPEASQRVLDLTQGHPYLLQLLCNEIVMLKNEQPVAVRRLARREDIEAAVPVALRNGSLFFADIQSNQISADSLKLLRRIADVGEGATVDRATLARSYAGDLEQALSQPIQRELIEAAGDGYRFQIELIRRSFLDNAF